MKLRYTVSKDENGYWYAHAVGFSNCPCMIDGRPTFSKVRRVALNNAAIMSGLTYEDYMKERRRQSGL